MGLLISERNFPCSVFSGEDLKGALHGEICDPVQVSWRARGLLCFSRRLEVYGL